MNTIMQLRKICNHPYMFQHIEVRLTVLIFGLVFIQMANKTENSVHIICAEKDTFEKTQSLWSLIFRNKWTASFLLVI